MASSEGENATNQQQQQRVEDGDDAAPDEANLLVSEFPPPPFYYRHHAELQPPPIPVDALARGTRRAAMAAARARAQAEKLRLAEQQQHGGDSTDAILGGVGVSADEPEEEGDVVAVFGEIVEDPSLVVVPEPCDDPVVVRDEVKRLNRQVLEGFVKLVQDLVHRPTENKKTRDELSHNIFLMLQECNKFREHQARELLIELLEKQLEQRRELTEELQEQITRADDLLPSSSTSENNNSSTKSGDYTVGCFPDSV